jgi:pimeloyl-ACP methyl ester carboxylesterase
VFSTEDAEAYARYTLGDNAMMDEDLVRAVARADGRARSTMWHHWTAQCQGVDQMRVLSTWSSPVAVIQGSDEPFFEINYFDRLSVSNLWRGQVQIVPNAGHAPFWEYPAQYNRLLGQFLEEVTQGAT